MKRFTRAELVANCDRYSKESSVAFRCLNAVINEEVEWFGLRPYRLGVVNPCGPEGGMIIVRYDPGGQMPYATAYLWEDWWPGVRDMNSFHCTPEKDERFKLRELAAKAHTYILKSQRELLEAKRNVV